MNKKYLSPLWILLACCILSCNGEITGSQGFEEESNALFYTVPISSKDLPLGIQNYITEHFPNTEITKVERHNHQGIISYEIFLSNGGNLLFSPKGFLLAIDREGMVDESDEEGEEVFASSLPIQIIQYILENYPNSTIFYSEKENNGNFEINLDNGLELYFDSEGNFIEEVMESDNDDDDG